MEPAQQSGMPVHSLQAPRIYADLREVEGQALKMKKRVTDIIAAAAKAEAVRAVADMEPRLEVVKKKPKVEREVIKEERLLKLVGALVVRCLSKYSGKMDKDTFKKYAKKVRMPLFSSLLSLTMCSHAS